MANFPLWDAPAGNHGSRIHYLGLHICFDEYSYHDSLRCVSDRELASKR